MIYYFIIYQLLTTEPTNVQNIPRYQQLPCGFELMTLCILIVFIVLFISITNIVKVLIRVNYFFVFLFCIQQETKVNVLNKQLWYLELS
jgi:hypothetical protein